MDSFVENVKDYWRLEIGNWRLEIEIGNSFFIKLGFFIRFVRGAVD